MERPKIEQLKMGGYKEHRQNRQRRAWNKFGESTMSMGVRLKQSTYDEILKHCDETGECASGFVRKAIIAALKNNGFKDGEK